MKLPVQHSGTIIHKRADKELSTIVSAYRAYIGGGSHSHFTQHLSMLLILTFIAYGSVLVNFFLKINISYLLNSRLEVAYSRYLKIYH